MAGVSEESKRRTRFFVVTAIVAMVLIAVFVICVLKVIIPAAQSGTSPAYADSGYRSVDFENRTLEDLSGVYVGYFSIDGPDGTTTSTRCNMILEAESKKSGTLAIRTIKTGLDGEDDVFSQTVPCTWNNGVLEFTYDMLGTGDFIHVSMRFDGYDGISSAGDGQGTGEGGSESNVFGRYYSGWDGNRSVYAEMMRI